MAAEAVLIQRPILDDKTLLLFTNKILNNNPAALLDQSNRDFTPDARQLIIFRVLADPGTAENALNALRDSGGVQGMLSYGFMCLASPGVFDDVVLMNSDLHYGVPEANYEQPMFFLAGPLDVWRRAVSVGSGPLGAPETRRLFNSIYKQFDKIGLAEIWYGCKRTENRDGTFSLLGG